MASDEQAIVKRAKADLARRLGVNEGDITEQSIEEDDFPDAALGVPLEDEMSAQVITPGWHILLRAGGRTYEYRATGTQLRLFDFDGENYKI